MSERRNAEQLSKIELDSEFFFNNNKDRIDKLTKIVLGYRKCEAAIESTAKMWISIHDT